MAGLALSRIAEADGGIAVVSIDRLRRVSPRLTPLAIGQLVRWERDTVEATVAERGLALVDDADQGAWARYGVRDRSGRLSKFGADPVSDAILGRSGSQSRLQTPN